LVREEGRLTINLPFGTDEDSKKRLSDFAQSVARLMVEQGRDIDEVGALITPSIVQRLDEERLNQLILDGKVDLISGTRTMEASYAVSINPLVKVVTPNRQRD